MPLSMFIIGTRLTAGLAGASLHDAAGAQEPIFGRKCDPAGMETYGRLRLFTGLRPIPAPTSGLAGRAHMTRRALRRVRWALRATTRNGAID